MKLSQKFTSLTNMTTSTDRQRTLEMACISQLAYVAYKQGNDIARDILKRLQLPLATLDNRLA